MNGVTGPWVLGGVVRVQGAVLLKQHSDSMGCLKITLIAGNEDGDETEGKAPLTREDRIPAIVGIVRTGPGVETSPIAILSICNLPRLEPRLLENQRRFAEARLRGAIAVLVIIRTVQVSLPAAVTSSA